MVALYNGDCLEVMKTLPDNAVDSVVCDPPYGLSAPPDVAVVLNHWLNDEEYKHSGKGFMGKDWDSFVPGPLVWKEAFRVLKPGGYLLAFASSRTSDLMGMSIRLAGFEIRDNIAWLYASGFPKSLDVAKAIDKAGLGTSEHFDMAGHIRARRRAAGVSVREMASWFPQHSAVCHNWERTDAGQRIPTAIDYTVLIDRLDCYHDGLIYAQREDARKLSGTTTDRRGDGSVIGLGHSGTEWEYTSDLAKKWNGWGTAMKPAMEPITVARKPFQGTVAVNVLKYGTGAINIDASRVAMSKADAKNINAKHAGMNADEYERAPGVSLNLSVNPMKLKPASAHDKGRFPANVILSHAEDCGTTEMHGSCVDGCPVAELDSQSGTSVSRVGKPRASKNRQNAVFSDKTTGFSTTTGPEYDDNGGASRFFSSFRFESKATKKEKPVVNGISHVTVKPLTLIRYLTKMVTPPGGVTLDPFGGSGTTAEAAILEGFDCIIVERESDFCALIEERLSKHAANSQ